MPYSDDRASAASGASATTPAMFIKRPSRLLLLIGEIFEGAAHATTGSVCGADVVCGVGVGGGVDAVMKDGAIFCRAVVAVDITSICPKLGRSYDTRRATSRCFILA